MAICNELGYSSTDPTGDLAQGRTIHNYASWWSVAVEMRGVIIEAASRGDVEPSQVRDWLLRWIDYDDASVTTRGLALIQPAFESDDLRFPDAQDLGLIGTQGDALNVLILELAKYVRQGDALLLSTKQTSPRIDSLRAACSSSSAPTAGGIAVIVGALVVLAAGIYFLQKDGGV